jgi:hypothetical protein
MNGYSEIQVSAAEQLRPEDRVRITWQIYQGGTWLVSYQATLIRQAFERDNRVKLLAHSYDPNAMTFGIDVEILGSSATVQVIADVAMGATWAFAYEHSRRHQAFRLAVPEPAAAEIPPVVAEPAAIPAGLGVGVVLALGVVVLLLME